MPLVAFNFKTYTHTSGFMAISAKNRLFSTARLKEGSLNKPQPVCLLRIKCF